MTWEEIIAKYHEKKKKPIEILAEGWDIFEKEGMIYAKIDFEDREVMKQCVPGSDWNPDIGFWFFPACSWRFFEKEWPRIRHPVPEIKLSGEIKFLMRTCGGIVPNLSAALRWSEINFFRTLVVCPTVQLKLDELKLDELKLDANLTWIPCDHKISSKLLEITNQRYDCIVIYKLNTIQGARSSRWRVLEKIVERIPYRVVVSPGLPNDDALFNNLKLICPSIFYSKWKFFEKYCGKLWNNKTREVEHIEPHRDKLDFIIYKELIT